MFDLGMLEMLVIGALALIVVGPKDLPGLLRTCGQYVGKMRGMAREFQRSMDDAARATDVKNYKEITDIQRDFEDVKTDYAAQAKASAKSVESSAPAGAAATDIATESAKPTSPAETPETATEETPPPEIAKPDPAPAETIAKTSNA